MSPLMIGLASAGALTLGFFTWKGPRLTSALIWAFVATFFVCAAYNVVGPGDFANRVFLTGFLSPIIWVGFQFWIYWNPSHWRIPALLIALSVVGGLTVFLSDPPI